MGRKNGGDWKDLYGFSLVGWVGDGWVVKYANEKAAAL